jgi:hypothetical protein
MDHGQPLTADATVATARASRYLVQLCRHVKLVAKLSPHMKARVEWSASRGVIDLGWGRCTLRAEPDALILRAEAGDQPGLAEIQRRVTERVEQVGRRDGLTVTWNAPWRNHAAE